MNWVVSAFILVRGSCCTPAVPDLTSAFNTKPHHSRMKQIALAAAAITLLVSTAGCLPIPVTRTLSPPVQGTYQSEDGAPIAGARMLLSTTQGDSVCARPAASAVTDSAGRFAFAATSHRESFVLLIPFDRLFCFQLCGGVPGAPLPGYRTCDIHGAPPSQIVWCVATRETAAPDKPRLACRSRSRRPGDEVTTSS